MPTLNRHRPTVNHQIKLNYCLNEVHDWFTRSGLVVNPEKSETLVFTLSQFDRLNPKTQTAPTEINVSGEVIPISVRLKILGVTVDRHLSFNAHSERLQDMLHKYSSSTPHGFFHDAEHGSKNFCIRSGHLTSRLANSLLHGTIESNIPTLQRA